ncbi:hypothetical protein ACFU90_03450 [Streptomyces noursei]|uniref:hypothetical protein n=1 Tax=Streptomyces noursei TaxID=1971 RepID=UPI000AAFAF5D|nr:hypothetical protein [Streptomyces noursei]
MHLRLVPGLLPEEPSSEHSPSWLNLSTDADEDEAAGKDASPRLVTNTDPEPAA